MRLRPRPPINQDTQFLWDGFKAREFRIQRCTACKKLRHPPGPACPDCHCLEWDYVVATGKGKNDAQDQDKWQPYDERPQWTLLDREMANRSRKDKF